MRELCVIEVGEGWAIRRMGELRLIASFETQQQALHAALGLAWKDQCDVLVQQRGGYQRLKPAEPPPPPQRRRRSVAER